MANIDGVALIYGGFVVVWCLRADSSPERPLAFIG
jgi:hypothetical protein